MILWPDVEALTINYLSTILPFGTFIGNVMPAPMPDTAVIVRDDGGPFLADTRSTARLGLQVWATTREECADLASLVTGYLHGWAEDNTTPAIVRSRCTRGFPVADDSGRPVRYLTAELWVRGVNP